MRWRVQNALRGLSRNTANRELGSMGQALWATSVVITPPTESFVMARRRCPTVSAKTNSGRAKWDERAPSDVMIESLPLTTAPGINSPSCEESSRPNETTECLRIGPVGPFQIDSTFSGKPWASGRSRPRTSPCPSTRLRTRAKRTLFHRSPAVIELTIVTCGGCALYPRSTAKTSHIIQH